MSTQGVALGHRAFISWPLCDQGTHCSRNVAHLRATSGLVQRPYKCPSLASQRPASPRPSCLHRAGLSSGLPLISKGTLGMASSARTKTVQSDSRCLSSRKFASLTSNACGMLSQTVLFSSWVGSETGERVRGHHQHLFCKPRV